MREGEIDGPPARRSEIAEFHVPRSPTPPGAPGGVGIAGASGKSARSEVARDRRRLILLPTLNEVQGLEATLEELDRTRFGSSRSPPSIVVVDGQSTDGTQEVAHRWGVPVLPQRSKGKGAAMREGLAWAARQGFSSVAVMDADGTYEAASLPAIFDLLELGSELVVGVRRTELTSRSSIRDLIHRVGNGLLNYAAAQFSRQPVLDVCSGFWGVRTAVLDLLDLESDGFDIEAELFVKSFRRGLHVSQIPVTYRSRVGDAKLHAIRDGARIFLSILRYSLRSGPAIARRARTGWDGSTTRPSLDSVLLALAPAHVILLSARERLSEADEVAKRLASASPNASVVTSVLPSNARSRSLGPLLPSLTEPVAGVGAIVVVTLPSGDGLGTEPPPVMVGIPRTGRVLHFPAPRGGAPSGRDLGEIAERQFRPERLPGGIFSALFILSASIEPTWTRRELALLGANAKGFPLGVFRHQPSPPPGLPRLWMPALGPSGVRSRPVAVG
ncbi:MAG TPA: glycosyltransferase family 2 protein [Thermoplasmata archaeon]|nr:glycosyltransferase family 2 protein [Thermoplasmata archaeon]